MFGSFRVVKSEYPVLSKSARTLDPPVKLASIVVRPSEDRVMPFDLG